MNKISTLFFCLCTMMVMAQNENQTKTLEVIGSSKVSITPDLGILNVTVTNIDSVFSQSINGLNTKSNDINAQLIKIGFPKSAIRTNNFDVRKNIVYRDNKSIDSGYVATQQIQLEFKNDQNNITKILNQFSKSRTEIDLSFNFKVSDSLMQSVQDQLIKLATADAFRKAKLIGSAAQIDLKKIHKINYSSTFSAGMKLFNNDQGMNEAVLRGNSSPSQGFTPTDIVYSDTILIVWNFE
ncbi:MAG: SIMPL domain-containing protein [Maribacter sp.]|nr:SIMPL domain-containing protein [Maribacter sp.]